MIIDLGLTDYPEAYRRQMDLVARRRSGEVGDSVLITEHREVYTIGRLGRYDNLLIGADLLSGFGIDVIRADRGGDITFHGPGQLVLYPIIDLRDRGRDLHRYLRDLESVVIDFLKGYGLASGRKSSMTGVWVDERKIASIGVASSNWITYHGLSVNIDVDLGYFNIINPCGMSEVRMTSLFELTGRRIDKDDASHRLLDSFIRVFGFKDDRQIGGCNDRCKASNAC